MMNIGVLGGTFDPVHNGHIAVAKGVKEEFGLDRVLFVVAAVPPHKLDETLAGGEARLALVQLALEPYPGLAASDLELARGGRSYTVDTFRQLRELWTEADLSMIVGADMLPGLDGWQEALALFQLARFIGVGRSGTPLEKEAVIARLRKAGARVALSRVEGPDISSTDIRERLYEGLPVEGLTPYAVEWELYEKGYYFPEKIRRMQEKLRRALNEKRYRHTVGTVRAAAALAERYGADPQRARVAALLHDCAKLNGRSILEQAREEGVPVSPEDERSPGLVHAEVGEVYARRDYGVTDPAVLAAIRCHTAGRLDMTVLDKIIYLADMIEPGRAYAGVERLRQAAREEPLDDALRLGVIQNIELVREKGARLHPVTLDLLKQLQTKEAGH